MTVFILHGSHEYEPPDLLGVFASVAGAEIHRDEDRRLSTGRWEYDHYSIAEFKVQE